MSGKLNRVGVWKEIPGRIVYSLCLAILLGTGVFAASGPKSPAGKTSSSEEAEETRARVAELEQLVEGIRAELKQKTEELEKLKSEMSSPDTAETPFRSEIDYAVDPQDEEMQFMNLGVDQNYVGFENRRLVDQSRTGIPPLYEPAFSPFHAYTLPAGAFRLTLNNDRFVNHSDFGRDEFYSAFFNKVKLENQHVTVNGFYGIDSNHTLRVSIPFKNTNISGTGEVFRIRPMVMTMEGQSFGLGDIEVMLKRKWFDQGYRRFSFATAVGVQVPTGDTDNRFSDSQTLFVGENPTPISALAGGPRVDLFSDDLRLPNSAQPGTGSWGLNAAVMMTRQLTWNGSRGAIHGGLMYRAMKDNAQGVRPGNELIFGVSYVRPPLPTDHMSFDLTLFGRNKQSERFPGLITHPEADPVTRMPLMNPDGSLKMFTTPRPPFEHGTVVFLSPSIIIIPKSTVRLTISPQFRIYEPERGPSPAFRLIFGIQSFF